MLLMPWIPGCCDFVNTLGSPGADGEGPWMSYRIVTADGGGSFTTQALHKTQEPKV